MSSWWAGSRVPWASAGTAVGGLWNEDRVLMSELMVVGYSERGQATSVLNSMQRIEGGWLKTIHVAALVRDRKGTLQIPEPRQLGQHQQVPWSVLWRGLLRTSGESTNGSSNSGRRPSSAVGIPDSFLTAVHAMMPDIDSTLIIWARTSVPPRIYEQLSASACEVVRSSLTPSMDALLGSVLDVLGPSEEERA